MNHYYGASAPPRNLAERLSRLNDNLQAVGERLKVSIAQAVGEAIADAVRDAVRSLLGSSEAADAYRQYRDRPSPARYRDGGDDPWGDEDRQWEDEQDYPPTRESFTREETPGTPNRWRTAMSAALQAAVWFIKNQPRRIPVLTTLAVTLTAGVTGFVAGPAFAAGAGVLASVAGLMLAADASRTPAKLAGH